MLRSPPDTPVFLKHPVCEPCVWKPSRRHSNGIFNSLNTFCRMSNKYLKSCTLNDLLNVTLCNSLNLASEGKQFAHVPDLVTFSLQLEHVRRLP